MIEFLTSHSQYCMSGVILFSKDSDYKIFHCSSSFISSGRWLMIVACIFTHWYKSLRLLTLPFCCVCTYIICCIVLQLITYCMVKNRNSTQIHTTLCHSPSPSSAVIDCYIWLCWYVRRRNNNNGLVCWSIMMSIYLLDLLPCPCPSISPRITTAQLSQVYTYNWVMLLMFYMMVPCWYRWIGTQVPV